MDWFKTPDRDLEDVQEDVRLGMLGFMQRGSNKSTPDYCEDEIIIGSKTTFCILKRNHPGEHVYAKPRE